MISLCESNQAVACTSNLLFSIWSFLFKIVYLATTPNGARGKTSSTDTEKIQNTLLESFWKIGTNKVAYWGLFGHKSLVFGEDCQTLRKLRPETG